MLCTDLVGLYYMLCTDLIGLYYMLCTDLVEQHLEQCLATALPTVELCQRHLTLLLAAEAWLKLY